MSVPTVILTSNASGAAESARMGYLVMVVDVIDMSTTMEALLDAGAATGFGAAPDAARPPVPVDPERMGEMAGRKAKELGTDVILVAEPRLGNDEERKKQVTLALRGIEKSGACLGSVLPNLGAETALVEEVTGRVILAATGTGGVAFDAAATAGAPAVITGTVARTTRKKGSRPAREAARRALSMARRLKTGISVVAASGNSLEDILAAEYIAKIILENW